MDPRLISRTVLAVVVRLGLIAVFAGACGASVDMTPPPSEPGQPTTAFGFPLGSFAKELQDPDNGHVRLVWTFGPDGRWTEVPFALDGQSLHASPVRGTYAVDAGSLTIATDYPPGWGTSEHHWRMDEDLLWTEFVGSDNPSDADWFEPLDTRPWTPIQ
ncbi:MAG: hypothetical protein ABI628_05895 [Chloroflexota bacterium]